MKHSTNQSQFAETDASVIRAELERLLADRRFSGARQMSAFLRYIVSETLDGNSKRIKAYTVGVDALGKADDFDAQADPSVRVLALRLRKSLEAAYTDDTECHARIVMSVGSYVPEFYKPHAFASNNGAESSRQTEVAAAGGDTGGTSMRNDLPNETNSASRRVTDAHGTAHHSRSIQDTHRSNDRSGPAFVNVARQSRTTEYLTASLQEKWVWMVLVVALLTGAWQASTDASSGVTATLNDTMVSTDSLRIMPVLPLSIMSANMSD